MSQLEETIRTCFTELDKQVQLKEKYAEETKILKKIINTHTKLRGLKGELEDVLNKECNTDEKDTVEEEVTDTPETVSTDSEWEDIDEDGYVKVTNKRKKKNQRRQQKGNLGNNDKKKQTRTLNAKSATKVL